MGLRHNRQPWQRWRGSSDSGRLARRVRPAHAPRDRGDRPAPRPAAGPGVVGGGGPFLALPLSPGVRRLDGRDAGRLPAASPGRAGGQPAGRATAPVGADGRPVGGLRVGRGVLARLQGAFRLLAERLARTAQGRSDRRQGRSGLAPRQRPEWRPRQTPREDPHARQVDRTPAHPRGLHATHRSVRRAHQPVLDGRGGAVDVHRRPVGPRPLRHQPRRPERDRRRPSAATTPASRSTSATCHRAARRSPHCPAAATR